MPSSNQNITCYAGDSAVVVIQLRQIPSTFNMTGATASWAAGSDPSTSQINDIVLSKTSAAGDIAIQRVGAGYSLRFTLTSDDTRSLGQGSWYHETQIGTSSGDHAVITVGRLYIKPVLIR